MNELKTKDKRFQLLRVEFGSLYRLAQILGLTTNAVYQWQNGRNIPIKYLKLLETLSEGRLTRQMLRPDLFD